MNKAASSPRLFLNFFSSVSTLKLIGFLQLFSSQIRTTLKKKAFEEAGVPIRQQILSQQSTQQSTVQVSKQQTGNQGLMGKSADVTLNMLNAPESEVDVEGLPDECQVKLEFEGATEEVAS